MAMEDEELITVQEAAKMLNISRMTLYRRINEGEIQAIDAPVKTTALKRQGGKRLRLSDVQALMGTQGSE